MRVTTLFLWKMGLSDWRSAAANGDEGSIQVSGKSSDTKSRFLALVKEGRVIVCGVVEGTAVGVE